MKKLVLTLSAVMLCCMVKAQEPEKKKSSPPRTRGQERAINEVGVSVKSDPKKPAKAKSTKPAPSKEEKKAEEKPQAVTKPE
jgi:hypothetical protein